MCSIQCNNGETPLQVASRARAMYLGGNKTDSDFCVDYLDIFPSTRHNLIHKRSERKLDYF